MRQEQWSDRRNALAWIRLLRDDGSGQNLIEYGLIVGLIALGAIAASSSLRNSVVTLFSAIGSQLAAST